jgi:hypothetical protein
MYLRSAVDAEQASACGRWGPPPGPSTRTNNPAGLSSRTPSPTLVIPSELGHAAHLSAHSAETPTDSTIQAESTGARRGRKGSWTKPRPGVMPGIRG